MIDRMRMRQVLPRRGTKIVEIRLIRKVHLSGKVDLIICGCVWYFHNVMEFAEKYLLQKVHLSGQAALSICEWFRYYHIEW